MLDLNDRGMFPGNLSFGKAAVALHYGICSLCAISASYRWAINNKNNRSM